MKKLLCLFAFSAVLLTSCSSSTSSSTPLTESDVLVTKTIEHFANDNTTITTNYIYDGKKLIGSNDSDGYYEEYTYVGDLITSVKSYDDTDALVTEETFAYNSSNLLITYVLKDFITDHGRKEQFVHNGSIISYTVTTGTAQVQDFLSETGTIYYSNGEVTHIDTNVVSIGNTYTRSYTYDSKNNPFKNITGYDKLNFINEEAIGVTRNVLTDHFLSATEDVTDTSTYTYNSLNFPLTGSDIEGTDATTQINTQYFYND
jgi:hypothetical protein